MKTKEWLEQAISFKEHWLNEVYPMLRKSILSRDGIYYDVFNRIDYEALAKLEISKRRSLSKLNHYKQLLWNLKEKEMNGGW